MRHRVRLSTRLRHPPQRRRYKHANMRPMGAVIVTAVRGVGRQAVSRLLGLLYNFGNVLRSVERCWRRRIGLSVAAIAAAAEGKKKSHNA